MILNSFYSNYSQQTIESKKHQRKKKKKKIAREKKTLKKKKGVVITKHALSKRQEMKNDAHLLM
jgi:hypothetical protein